MKQRRLHNTEAAVMNILVVFKKNFEEVHDEGLMAIKTVLQAVAST